MTNAAGGDAHVAYADSKSDAVAFSYNTFTKNFEVTMNVGSTPHNCILGVYTDNKPVFMMQELQHLCPWPVDCKLDGD